VQALQVDDGALPGRVDQQQRVRGRLGKHGHLDGVDPGRRQGLEQHAAGLVVADRRDQGNVVTGACQRHRGVGRAAPTAVVEGDALLVTTDLQRRLEAYHPVDCQRAEYRDSHQALTPPRSA
jgi:hypothetical protein